MKLPIIKYRKVWFGFSLILVALSVASLVMYPIRFGIDFTGGSLMDLKFSGAPATDQIRALMVEKGYNDNVVQPAGANDLIIRFKLVDETTHQALLSAIRAKWPDVQEQQFQSVGPTVGDELRTKAAWSISLVIIGICSYIAFAFRKVSKPVASWKYGIITLIPALGHDVLLPIAVTAVLGHFLAVEVNSAFIAAILTVLGFSVHDTIVVFDRIRENLLKTTGTFEEIVERSVNETLARSINTSLTVFFPLLATFLWGGETIRWFALTLIVGLIAGTYSSIFLCAPLLVVFQKKRTGR